ncbi:MAG: bifunctional UDP-N-acetylglucosamine diphosphorylase/glucosamine-1-phosphate N-acetyltransferase GlmU [Rhodospirillaceae bacterium]|nr:bifunctional UDP-N-acetylglucosamine diphosphorylase/glucosamine-1-phosphate N-acetyltransferase GlmU [Rhodospirillaceae bacterium]
MTSSTPTAAVVLAAGMGTRMRSTLPKVMHAIGGRPMVGHVMATLAAENIAPVVVVVGPDMDMVAKAVEPHQCVIQKDRLGTGHAVLQARNALAAFSGDVLIAYGDTPFVSAETMRALRAARRVGNEPAIVALGFSARDPGAYGRLIVGANGLERIVEAKDATPAERETKLCNSGIMLADSKVLWDLLAKVQPNNTKGEYYLTDVVGLARKAGLACAVVEGDEEEMLGINSRAELAEAEGIFQRAARKRAMENGATLTAPDTVFFSADTQVGKDVEIGPFVVLGPRVVIDDNVVIKGFCHFEGAHIAPGAIVGPYARLRPGADIGPDAHVGNFVEVKNATLESGAKVNHLSYVGDARVGSRANVGAGTITANYDGFNKSHTDIGAGTSIGSNTVLVAPVKLGDGAMTGAGAVVRKDVPADALTFNEGSQKIVEGFAAKYRKQKQAQKDKKK